MQSSSPPPSLPHPIAVLRYGAIGAFGPRLSTPPALLQAHLSHLDRQGYAALRLDEFEAILAGRQPSQPRQVLITFDGGCRGVYRRAWSHLIQRCFPATLFMPAGRVQQPGEPNRDWDYLDWEELRTLRELGGFDVQLEWPASGTDRALPGPGKNPGHKALLRDLAEARRLVAGSLGLAPEALCHVAWNEGVRHEVLEETAATLGFTHQYVLRRGGVTRPGETLRIPRLDCGNLPLEAFAQHLGWLSHRNGARIVNLASAMGQWSRKLVANS